MLDFLQGLDNTVLCALISVFGTVISALIAWLVSRTAANKELKKMRLEWEREDIVTSDDDFAEMAAAVAYCMHNHHHTALAEAIGKVNSVRAREKGVLAEALDRLHNELRNTGCTNHINLQKIDACLTEVIQEKRKAQSGKKPNG